MTSAPQLLENYSPLVDGIVISGLAPKSLRLINTTVGELEAFLSQNGLTLNETSLVLFFERRENRAASINAKKWAIKRWLLDRSPDIKTRHLIETYFKDPRLKPTKIDPRVDESKTLKHGELKALFNLGPSAPIRRRRTSLLLKSLYLTGCRLSELLNAKHKDVDSFENHVSIEVKGKRNKTRKVFLPLDVYQQLRLVFTGEEYLFSSESNDKINPASFRRSLSSLVKFVGIEKHVHPHMTRHSFATNLLAEKTDVSAVSKLLGHSSVSTTLNFYNHADIKASEVFSKLL